MPADDPRRPLELRFEILATEEQALVLQDVIGAAICGEDPLHDGPCRIAWSGAVLTELANNERDFIWETLGPIPTWPQGAVDSSLGIRHEEP